MPQSSGSDGAPLPIDGITDGWRELAGLLTGTLNLNGSTITDPGYTDSPTSVTQAAITGELALVRLRATASNGSSTQPIYSDVRGTGGAYSSMSITTNGTDQYKALYVIRTEDLSVRVHNRASYSGALNSPAAFVNYTYETGPIEDIGEPNDDENPSTISDRTLASALGIEVTATRSLYQYSASVKDEEEWYATTLTAGRTYRYRLASFNPRYGTWGYTLKLYNAAGTKIGATTTIATGNAAGNLTTPAIPATGTYYLQVAGTPATRTFSSNLYYSQYSLTICEVAIPDEPEFTLNGGATEFCAGNTGTWSVNVTPAPASYNWSFGPGCIPSSSTLPNPTVTLASSGIFTGSLTVTSSCGATDTRTFSYSTGCNWTRTMGTPTGISGSAPMTAASKIVVDANNLAHVVGIYSGQDTQFTAQENISSRVLLTPDGGRPQGMFYLILNSNGTVARAQRLIDGNATPRDLALTSMGELRVIGSFTGNGLDFDPGPATYLLSSPGTTDAFCQAIDAAGNLQWAIRWGGTSYEHARSLLVTPSNGLEIVGDYQSPTVDFDPGSGTQLRAIIGNSDGFWLSLMSSGDFSQVMTFGGPDIESATDIVSDASDNRYIIGRFRGTADFNPSGVTTRVSAGGDDAFCAKYSSTGSLLWTTSWGSTGPDSAECAVRAGSDDLRIAGAFRGTVDFDPGAGLATRTSASLTNVDTYVLGFSGALGTYQWVSTWGGNLDDRPVEIALNPMNNRVAVYGTFQQTVDFDPGAGYIPVVSTGATDVFISLLTSAGNYVTHSTIGTTGTDYPYGLATGSDGRLQTCGAFRSPMDFKPGAGTATITPRGTQDAYVQRLSDTGTY